MGERGGGGSGEAGCGGEELRLRRVYMWGPEKLSGRNYAYLFGINRIGIGFGRIEIPSFLFLTRVPGAVPPNAIYTTIIVSLYLLTLNSFTSCYHSISHGHR